VRESDDRCQLSLGGSVCGHGTTLQEAADDLVERILVMVMCIRSTGLTATAEAGAVDVRWLDYLWQLGELAANGGDIRTHLFTVDAA
jgi:hypothetical protein